VGIAMGRSGTEAAREASAIVLTDDDLSTIVAAVREGRATADNVRTFVAFLLSANLGEVLLFGAAVLGGLGPPLGVVQVLTVNLVTDGAPAVALAVELPGAGDVLGTVALGPGELAATLGLAAVPFALAEAAKHVSRRRGGAARRSAARVNREMPSGSAPMPGTGASGDPGATHERTRT
jgi:hypothetical protein